MEQAQKNSALRSLYHTVIFLTLLSACYGADDGRTISPNDEVRELRDQLAVQQKQIDELRRMVMSQQERIAEMAPGTTPGIETPRPSSVSSKGIGEVASLTPILPPAPIAAAPTAPFPAAAVAPEPQAQPAPDVGALQRTLEAAVRNLNGFRFSGDFRFRMDLLNREANPDYSSGDNRSTPLQRVRSRYRVRFNIDKDAFFKEGDTNPLAHFHVQIATDPYNNPLTMDTDYNSFGTRAPFSLAEAYVDLTPLKGLSFRVGRTPELYADNRQFVYDDDIRFNGFHETYRFAAKNSAFLQFSAAQYILTDPNVQVVPAGSPYLSIGYALGSRVPSSGLFDQGITVGGNFNKKWNANFTFNFFAVREPNQIQLASTAAGAVLFANNPVVGALLIANEPGTGNATTTPGGPVYFADDFQVFREAFNLNYTGSTWRGHNFPFQLFLQTTHNKGGRGIDDTGYMLGASIGQAQRLGDFQLQYQYYYKPANAFISQFTDDDVGTGTGVNLKNNQIRVNLGLTRFLAWENRLYIQKGISVNNPAINYYVPLQQGYSTQYRWHSQFVFTF